MQNWYLLRCKPRQDRIVVKYLENQNYKAYSPRVLVNKSKTLVVKKVLEPLFPGYLFVRLDADKTNWMAICSTRGVLDFVRFGRKIAVVHDSIVERIQEQVGAIEINSKNNLDGVSTGDVVRITEGCFEGFEAVYQYRSGKDRVMVLIKFMGKLNEVRIKSKSVELA